MQVPPVAWITLLLWEHAPPLHLECHRQQPGLLTCKNLAAECGACNVEQVVAERIWRINIAEGS